MSSDLKYILVVVAVALGVLGGIMYFGNKKATVTGYNAWTLGDSSAKVTIEEFSDYECPACGSAHSPLSDAIKDSGGKAKLVYYHFPLPQHTNARAASYAAEAAGKQNRFWELHNILFETQNDWSSAKEPYTYFEKYASALSLDMTKFKSDYESEDVKNKVEASYQIGEAKPITETPTFYVNGKKYTGAKTKEEWAQIIKDTN